MQQRCSQDTARKHCRIVRNLHTQTCDHAFQDLPAVGNDVYKAIKEEGGGFDVSIEHLGKYPPDNAHHIKIRLGDNVNSYYCTKLLDSLTDYSSSWYPHWIDGHVSHEN